MEYAKHLISSFGRRAPDLRAQICRNDSNELLYHMAGFCNLNTSGVILPGEEASIPLIFLSKQAGIYTESWQFITKPVLDDGAPIIVTLKGVALKRDIYKDEKEKIEVQDLSVESDMSTLVVFNFMTVLLTINASLLLYK